MSYTAEVFPVSSPQVLQLVAAHAEDGRVGGNEVALAVLRTEEMAWVEHELLVADACGSIHVALRDGAL